jgi:GTP:adenosylcobinamide-phosphate guanylyltransferase
MVTDMFELAVNINTPAELELVRRMTEAQRSSNLL